MTETDDESASEDVAEPVTDGASSLASAEPEPATRNPMLVLAIGVPVVLLTWLLWRWMYMGEPYIPKRVAPPDHAAPR